MKQKQLVESKQNSKVVKLTAERFRTDFRNELWVVIDGEESYQKVASPFYGFLYEQIKELRSNKNEETNNR